MTGKWAPHLGLHRDVISPSQPGPPQQEVVSARAGSSIKAGLVWAERPVGRQNRCQAVSLTSRRFVQLGNQSCHKSRDLPLEPHAPPGKTMRGLVRVDSFTARALRGKVTSGEWRKLDPIAGFRVP